MKRLLLVSLLVTTSIKIGLATDNPAQKSGCMAQYQKAISKMMGGCWGGVRGLPAPAPVAEDQPVSSRLCRESFLAASLHPPLSRSNSQIALVQQPSEHPISRSGSNLSDESEDPVIPYDPSGRPAWLNKMWQGFSAYERQNIIKQQGEIQRLWVQHGDDFFKIPHECWKMQAIQLVVLAREFAELFPNQKNRFHNFAQSIQDRIPYNLFSFW